ncbi:unnamed protein product, partial [Dicrocoelium dendriticum]
TADTATPCPVELSTNPTAQHSAVPDIKKSRRKLRDRPVQTYAIKDGDAKMEGNHMSLPDSADNKPLLDDSEFEVVEAPFLSSCSPGPSSESDHGITNINPTTTVSASAEIPSISSIEEFPGNRHLLVRTTRSVKPLYAGEHVGARKLDYSLIS